MEKLLSSQAFLKDIKIRVLFFKHRHFRHRGLIFMNINEEMFYCSFFCYTI